MKRTVVPVLIVSLLGANGAWLVPLPVIFTSTTAPAGSAVGAGVAASAWDAADFFSPPQATAVNATSVVSRVNRIANSLRDDRRDGACERVHNIFASPENGSPPVTCGRCAFAARPRHWSRHAGAIRPAYPRRPPD